VEVQSHLRFARERVTDCLVRDVQKKELCVRLGITLIDVPYWWDGTEGSLRATIARKRTDLDIEVPTDAKPIEDSMPIKEDI